MLKDTHMDIIAEYYMALGKFSQNEKYSESSVRVYTLPESDSWLVLERKGENAIQARMTDESGKIISRDNYKVVNATIKQNEAICLSASGDDEVLFTPTELNLIDCYADFDRKTTMGKLDIMRDQVKDGGTREIVQSLTDKLERISDKSYSALYSVRQRKLETEKENSLGNRMKKAQEKADRINAENGKHIMGPAKRKGILL